MKNVIAIGVAVFAFASSAGGSDAVSGAAIKVQLRDDSGMPIRDAVVTVHPAGGVPADIRFPWQYAMGQKDIAFVPGTLIVPQGARVSFPNYDRVRHSIYSFSDTARFEIPLYGQDQTRSQPFPKTGNVALGCNIHDEMRGYIKVVDTPWAQKTDANGRLTLAAIPAGGATVRVWHPALRARGQEEVRELKLTNGTNPIALTLRTR